MRCAACRQSVSIIQLWVGHTCSHSEHRAKELNQIQRLLNAVGSDRPERQNVSSSEKITISSQAAVTAVYEMIESQTTDPADAEAEPIVPVSQCSRSWRCRCPDCTAADMVPAHFPINQEVVKKSQIEITPR
jgi:hypothetical protein